ncbi:MAG: hypothetical protein KIT17_02680 [Rubrivivax sp.]|nr:hypothetical protein [Rubrivivax sp.]
MTTSRRISAAALYAAALTAAAAVAAGCASPQLYAAGQQWQRNECRKLPPAEQDRCLKSTAMSFEEYQREAAAARVPR